MMAHGPIIHSMASLSFSPLGYFLTSDATILLLTDPYTHVFPIFVKDSACSLWLPMNLATHWDSLTPTIEQL